MGATYYIQICPTCGRRLEIKIEYIGLEVSCYHCRARFLAENLHTQTLSGMHGPGSVITSVNDSTLSYCVNSSTEPVSSFS